MYLCPWLLKKQILVNSADPDGIPPSSFAKVPVYRRVKVVRRKIFKNNNPVFILMHRRRCAKTIGCC